MSGRHAPYAQPRQKKPPPPPPSIIEAHEPPEQEPPKEKPPTPEPTRSAITQQQRKVAHPEKIINPVLGEVEVPAEKELPPVHLGDTHDYYDMFKPKAPREQRLIYGRRVESEPPTEKPPTEGTKPIVTEERTVGARLWGNIGDVDTVRRKDKHYKLVPADKKNAENTQAT